MNKAINILLAFNAASRRQAEHFAEIVMEAFNSGNVTDAQVEDVSGLLEKQIQWCAQNREEIYDLEMEMEP